MYSCKRTNQHGLGVHTTSAGGPAFKGSHKLPYIFLIWNVMQMKLYLVKSIMGKFCSVPAREHVKSKDQLGFFKLP